MEATVAAAVPPSQTSALSAQPSPRKHITPTQESLNRVTSTAAPAPNTPTRDLYKRTGTTQQSPSTPVQPFYQKSSVFTPSSPQRTLPEVQNFLQRAYKTAERSPQNAIAAAHLKAIAPVTPSSKMSTAIVLDSLQKTWVTTQLPLRPTIPENRLPSPTAGTQSATSTIVKAAPESLSKPMAAPPTARDSKSAEITQPNTIDVTVQESLVSAKTRQVLTDMGFYPDEKPTTSKAGPTGTYVCFNRNLQAKTKPRQGSSSPEKRSVLVAKRRQSSNVPDIEEPSETGQSGDQVQSSGVLEKVQGTVQIPFTRSVSIPEKTPRTQSPLTSRAPFWNVFEKISQAQSPQNLTTSVSERTQNATSAPIPIARSLSAPEKMPLAQSPQSSSAPSTSVSDKLQSALTMQTPKDSQRKQGPSRVANTYQTYNASQGDRGTNGPKTATQSPKKVKNPPKSGSVRSANGRRPVYQIQDDVDPRRRVLVSGFPPYTQPQDLTRVLNPFGSCNVDKCRNRLAVITFDSEAAAKSAMKATEDICIYGEFIEIKPFTNPKHVEDMFRAYNKVIATQKGQDVTPPNQINLSGDFYKQMDNIQNAIRLSREQVQAVTNLYSDLEIVLQQEWPGCIAIPFGSIPTGLGIKSSDADCYVELPPASRGRGAGGAGFVQRARRLLALYPRIFTHLVAIPRANTPIVKFRHVPTGFHCDVSAKTPLGAQNSKLIKLLLEADPRLAPLAVLLKYWARAHELSGTGRLTNYALVMMIVFYLQYHARVSPPVERLQRDHIYIVDHWNAGFAPRIPPLAQSPAAKLPIPDLLGGFFQFYANFDFNNLVVCPFIGEPIPKTLFDSPHLLPAEFARYVTNVRENLASPIRHNTPFCVQDPFEQSHNVASSVSVRLAADIQAYLKFAAEAYSADRSAGCPTFLRTILLTRPKIRRERVTPTTKILLIPRVRGEIVDPEWRARVRDIVLNLIFEKILKITLKRDLEKEEANRQTEEKREAIRIEQEKKRAEKQGTGAAEAKVADRKPKPKVEKEQYTGSATKPVWRRKKNYTPYAPESGEALVARQRAATDDIINNCAGEVRLEFDIELGFRETPKSFYLFTRMVEGEIDTFSGFATFIHTAMFDWFRILLRPYLVSPKQASVRAILEAEEAMRIEARQACSIVFERVEVENADADTQRDDPADTRVDDPADTRVDDSADTWVDDPADTRVDDPADTRVDDPADISRDLSAVSLADLTDDSKTDPTATH